jgi:hypothetical protein
MVTEPIQLQGQPQQYTQAPVYMTAPTPKPYPGFLENRPLAALILVGVIFLLVGAILVNVAPELTNKDYSSISDSTERSKATAADQRAKQALTDFGNVFKSIGVFFIFAFLLMAAVLRNDIPDYARFGILLMLGLIMLGSTFLLP